MNTFKEVNDLKNIGMIKLDKNVYTLKQLYEMKDIVVNGDVDLSSMGLTKLPHFKSVGGDFYCDSNKLTNLEGCPTSVGGGFYCDSNKLTNLEGCPTSIGGDFRCGSNKLTSLKYCPTRVGG
jgi:hypothetical protein